MVSKKVLGWIAAATIAGVGASAAIPAFAASNTAATTNQQTGAAEHHHKHPDHLKEVASVLGIDAKTLRADLKAGQSIADVAQSKGISEQTVISKLQDDLKSHLDVAVKNGKMTADKEQTILAKAPARIQKLVEHKGLFKKHKHHKRQMLFNEVSSVIGVDKQTLRADLKAGQSIAEVAQSKGISEQTLIADLQGKLQSRLDQAVADGKITKEKESQILSHAQTRIQKLVEHKFVKKQA
ncbi:hypothetical protein LSG31_15645 [Fodinisporobacter ferrooxydans]|uniref:LysM domain-containing protein n=1 Tax=Fodinisporobacter ferrooxydans TaxID=2901836 RepID=A0ABY4CN88_9BACL|nr:hypothetical protein LSG31_15645 [Alicyclobacillaceae bacterium MYW30-H2]